LHHNTFNAWLVTGLVACAILYDLRTDIRRALRGRNIVLFCIFSFFLMQGITDSSLLEPYSQATFDYAILCVALAVIFFLVGYHATNGWRIFLGFGNRMSRLDDPRLLGRVTFICAIVGFAPVLVYADFDIPTLIHGIMGQRKTWGGVIGRGRFGDMRAAILMLEFFAVGAGPLALALILDLRSSALQKIFAVPVVIWPLLRGFGSGARSALLASLLPSCAVVYFKSGPKLQRLIIIGALVISPIFFHLMKAMGASRNSGSFSWAAGSHQKAGGGNEMLNELTYIIDNIPKRAGYQLGYCYYFQMVSPVPRFLWPGKPTEEVGIFLARLKGAYDRRTGAVFFTNAPGIIGEMYLNFGIFGVIVLSTFGGWVVRSWDLLIDEYSTSICTMIFYCMGLAGLCLIGRGFHVHAFYGMVAFYVGTWLLIRVSKKPAFSPALPAVIGPQMRTLR
jgi:oligosaccharide repeat unit polymerase